MNQPDSSLQAEVGKIPGRVFKPIRKRFQFLKSWLSLKTYARGTVERVVRSGPAMAYGLRNALLDPTPVLDLDSLSEWKQWQSCRRHELTRRFQASGIGRICLSHNIFRNTDNSDGQTELVDLAAIDSFAAGTIFILNSNDVLGIGLKNYAEKYLASPEAFVAVWDFDNHHALSNSFILASFSDLYIPCHDQNLATAAIFTDAVTAPVRAGVIQWSRAYLKEKQDMILREDRDPDPLGRHIVYREFKNRSRMLEALGRHFDNVGPVPIAYHHRSDEGRLAEWCAHMSHWTIPTFNDMPIRIFDALITGGIPIAPRTLRHDPALAAVREHIFFFDEADLADPWAITNAANDHFRKAGKAGILARHRAAMEYCHVDSKVETMLGYIRTEFIAEP